MVLANDGSRDNSDTVCRRLQAAHPEMLTHLCLSRNFGEHKAVMAGLKYSIGDYCAIMDDDLQNHPEELLKMVDKIEEGYDVVYTEYAGQAALVFPQPRQPIS